MIRFCSNALALLLTVCAGEALDAPSVLHANHDAPVLDRMALAEKQLGLMADLLQKQNGWIAELQEQNHALHAQLRATRESLAGLHSTVQLMPEYHRAFFEHHYWSELWGPVWQPSGRGSDARFASTLRDELEMIIFHYDVKSITDVPCGDMRWIVPLLARRPMMSYVGIDVVRPLLESNRIRFADNPQWRFLYGDVTAGEVPSEVADLVICRDLIQHLRVEGVKRVLNALKRAARFILVSSHHDADILNMDVSSRGEDVRSHAGELFGTYPATVGQNLQLPPFNLPEPISRISDGPGRYMLLYRSEDIPDVSIRRVPSYVFGDIRSWQGPCDGWEDFARLGRIAEQKLWTRRSSRIREVNWTTWRGAAIMNVEGSAWENANWIGVTAVAAILWAADSKIAESVPGPLSKAIETLRAEMDSAGMLYSTDHGLLLRAALGIQDTADEASQHWQPSERLAALARAIGFDAWESRCFQHYFPAHSSFTELADGQELPGARATD